MIILYISTKLTLLSTMNLHVGKMDETENANFLFKNKSYVDVLLQKL